MNPVKRKQKLHNPDSPLLMDEVKDGDVVKDNEPNYIGHNKIFKIFHYC